MSVHPRTPRRALCCAAALIAVIAGLGGCGDGADGRSYALSISPLADDGPRGQGNLTQDGETVTGTIVISDLDAGVAYALELRGKEGETFGCEEDERTDDRLIEFPEFTAGDGGDADIEVDLTAPEETLRAGAILVVHAGPQGAQDYGVTSDEPLACAVLR